MPITTEQEFNRYSIAAFDFARAKDFATEAQRHLPNTLVHESCLFAAIVCYCRPFTSNERVRDARATSRLNLQDLVSLDGQWLQLHESCMTLRNKALAHSEIRFNPTRLNPDTGIVASRPFSLLSPEFDVDALIQLIDKLLLTVNTGEART